ncbi:MAG TPA: histidine kinase, partial [Phnomibacter sp.]|nr:histidine kinase [Phnomibacter sp.]
LFDHSDNVQGYGFNLNSWYKDNDGTLFLGGYNGLNYLQPEKMHRKQVKLQPWLLKVKPAHGELIDVSKGDVEIPYSQRSVDLYFVAPYFNDPDKVLYRYRLDGYDNEWKEIGNSTQLRLTSLPARKYALRLQAGLQGGQWFDAPVVFAFRIRPPFWQMSWFIVLVLAAVAALLYLLVRNRNRKIEEKQEELEAEQAINYFSTGIYGHQTVEDILWDVARNCIGRLHFQDCVIYLLDEDRNVLVQKAALGPKSPEPYTILDPIEIPIGQGITGAVAKSGVAEIINDTLKDARYIKDDRLRRSEIAVPMIAEGRVFGVIDCEHSKRSFFTQRHLSILTTIASLCAGKIIKAREEEKRIQAEQILMATEKKMAEVEMQALRAQMNPHFIFNCLNSINRYIVKSDQATASLYLTRFARLIRLILDNSNSTSITLTNELEALRLYIEMESIRFEKQFSYKILVDPMVQPDMICVPPLIIQPYVDNAIWHGLLHKDTAGNLEISVHYHGGGLLQVEVTDNGVGRVAARALKSRSANTCRS